MTSPVNPKTYAQWHIRITVESGIVLTRTFVNERLSALGRSVREWCRRFTQLLYGKVDLRRVHAWFEEARRDLDVKPTRE